jgi:hypothetical protein
LIRLDLGSDHPDVWLKLENLQPTLVDRGFYRGTTGLPAGHLEDPRVSAGKRQLISTSTSDTNLTWSCAWICHECPAIPGTWLRR